MEVIRFENSILSSNSFLLSAPDRLDYWLVDVGDLEEILAFLPKGGVIKGVLLTHTHYDHIYGLNDLFRLFPNITVYTSVYGHKALCDYRLNFSLVNNVFFSYSGNNVVELHEDDKLDVLDSELIVEETPGHCPSCLSYYNDSYIFTGDSYIPGVATVVKLPKSNPTEAFLSELRIKELSINKTICPGHGPIRHV